jgi:hypothetical protein
MLSKKSYIPKEEYIMANSSLVPEAKQGLAKFKNEVASEMGVQFSDYNGNLTSKQCGSVGGEMVKRMVQQYESGIK